MTVLDEPRSTHVDHSHLPDLLARIAVGDSIAFADFYDHTADRVYGMILRILRDPGYSEETTQEVFLEVWRQAGTYRPDRGSALSWLLTMAHRRAVDRVRSESAATRRTIGYGIATVSIDFDAVGEAVEIRQSRQAVLDCLSDLTELQRESVVLAYYHGLSYPEVAEHLSVSLPTVKSRIRDGMRRLRASLGSDN
ncbi:ECF RNA polymerase sigma factor SigK [Gordonia sp. CPCC 205515]|uniref:ECF RNA polymerase sigma factor SigK n=1 Tax=Gordonia sp. CPCC 205515 TaxID=3140791 RepID=UPI003AF3E71D